jgi:hypothetical protein
MVVAKDIDGLDVPNRTSEEYFGFESEAASIVYPCIGTWRSGPEILSAISLTILQSVEETANIWNIVQYNLCNKAIGVGTPTMSDELSDTLILSLFSHMRPFAICHGPINDF